MLTGRRKVIVIDAIEGDYEPGTVLRLRPEDLAPGAGGSISAHEIGVLETLAAARQLGTCPQEVVVLGVKPFDTGCGLELSAEITRLVPQIIELVQKELAGDGPC